MAVLDRPGRRPVRRGDFGSVTAETALALPAVVLALGLVLGVVEVGTAQVRCIDAARAGARRAARGEAPAAVAAAARALAPPGAGVTVARAGRTVAVTVTVSAGLPLPGAPAVPVRAVAVADAEVAAP